MHTTLAVRMCCDGNPGPAPCSVISTRPFQMMRAVLQCCACREPAFVHTRAPPDVDVQNADSMPVCLGGDVAESNYLCAVDM